MAKKKAKHASNQAALDRLQEVLDNTSSQNYQHTLRRAISSVAACPNAIETRKHARELKGVGPQVAKVLIPQEASLTTSKRATNNKDSFMTKAARRTLPNKSTSSLSSSSSFDGDWKTLSLSSKQIAYNKAVAEAESLILPNGPWTVVLILDGREQRAEHVQAKLQMSGVPCEQRNLPIGDMAWMARCGDNVEIMLGTIVERKEVADLASSLFGTRYLEQRLRLQHCGLAQLLLLVEGNISSVSNCPADTLEAAMMETRVMLNFQVITTRHLDDTVRFLKNVHRRILQRSFPSAFGNALPTSLPSFGLEPRRKKNKISLEHLIFDTPPLPPVGQSRFVTYSELKTKVERDREAGTRTVGATHARMLKQISNFSVKKVRAIQQAYPTPQALYGTFVGLAPEDGKTLVSDFTTTTGMERNCRVGPKSAIELYHMCTEGGTVPTLAVTNDSSGTWNTETVIASTATMSQESLTSNENVARMPRTTNATDMPADDDCKCSPIQCKVAARGSLYQATAKSSQDYNSKPPAIPKPRSILDSSPPRAGGGKTNNTGQRKASSPTFSGEEMDGAIRRRHEHFQAFQSQSSIPHAGLVDLTLDTEVVSTTTDNNNNNSQSVEPATSRTVSNSGPSLSQTSNGRSMDGDDDEDEEPLHVRCERLYQARLSVLKPRADAAAAADKCVLPKANKTTTTTTTTCNVIEIE